MNYGHVGLGLLLSAAMLAGQSNVATTEVVPVNVRARVCDAAGLPIEGACVVVGRLSELTTATALNNPDSKSNANGVVDFVARVPPPPHELLLGLVIAARGRVAYLHPTPFFRAGAEVKALPELDLGEVRLPKGHTISGRVRGKGGKPIVGAQVKARDGLTRYGWMSPSFSSQAVTNARGVFALPGVFANVMSVKVQAEGYYERKFPSVDIGTPLDVQLQESGFVEGTVLDDAGQPAEGIVRVSHEFISFGEQMSVLVDGRFRIGVTKPGRFRITAFDDSRLSFAQSELLHGPASNIKVREDQDRSDRLVVRAVDANTKLAVPKLRASVMWFDHTMDDHMRNMLKLIAVPSGGDGKVVLDAPSPDEGRGLICVLADGYAPLFKSKVKHQPGEDFVAKLVRGASIMGRIVDAQTGKPVAGAEVTCVKLRTKPVPSWERPAKEVVVVTDADGAFEFSELARARYEVVARRALGTARAVKLVKVRASSQVTGVEVSLPNGVTVAGKLVGATPPAGSKILLSTKESLEARGSEPYYGWPGTVRAGEASVRVVDGAFSFPSRAPGAEHLVLVVPSAPRQGAALYVPLAAVPIGAADLSLEVNLAARMPGTVAGTLEIRGINAPGVRFVVVAKLFVKAGAGLGGQVKQANRVRWSLADANGRYSIALAPGDYTVQVMDPATGLSLWSSPEPFQVAAAKQTPMDLQVDVVAVTTQFRVEGGGSMSADRVEIVPAGQQDYTSALFAGGSHGSPGFDLVGTDAPTFFVPPGQVTLKVKAGASRIDRGSIHFAHGNLMEHSFDAELGKRSDLTIELPPPPTLEVK